MRGTMTVNELHSKIVAAKNFLNHEIVRIRTSEAPASMDFREIGDRLDMIHEVERIGIRNLNATEVRRVTRMLTQIESIQTSSN